MDVESKEVTYSVRIERSRYTRFENGVDERLSSEVGGRGAEDAESEETFDGGRVHELLNLFVRSSRLDEWECSLEVSYSRSTNQWRWRIERTSCISKTRE